MSRKSKSLVRPAKNVKSRRKGATKHPASLQDTSAIRDSSGVLIIPSWTQSSGISYCKHIRTNLFHLLDEKFCPLYTYAKHCSHVRFRNHHVEEWDKAWNRITEVAQAFEDSGFVSSLAYKLKVKPLILFKMASLFYLTGHESAAKLCLSSLYKVNSVEPHYAWAGTGAGLVALAVHIMSDTPCMPLKHYPDIDQLDMLWDYREGLSADPESLMAFISARDDYSFITGLRYLVLALYDKWVLDHNLIKESDCGGDK